MESIIQAVLAALYLRGAPRSFAVKRSGWRAVERSLRLTTPALRDVPEALREDGLWAEALALDSPGLLSWAEDAVGEGKVLTPCHPHYFARWLERLGSASPPALWASCQPPSGRFITVVGSRDASPDSRRFAARIAEEAVRLRYEVASGGARGCDAAASKSAAPHAIELLPYGLDRFHSACCGLSLCAPDEEFSTPNAMERNALLYALAEAAVVVHSRFKKGGTWHGAVDSQRRRLTRLLVREDADEPGHRALIALGAMPLRSPEGLAEALQAAEIQPKLVG